LCHGNALDQNRPEGIPELGGDPEVPAKGFELLDFRP
jgi:hypothetical protein